jgi:hypothetical protein
MPPTDAKKAGSDCAVAELVMYNADPSWVCGEL